MHRAVVEAHAPGTLHPGQGVLQPVLIVALGEILARMRAAALGAVGRRMDGRGRLQQQILELERLDQIGVPDERAVGDAHVGEGLEGRADASGCPRQGSRRCGTRRHRAAWSSASPRGSRRYRGAVGIAQPIEPRHGASPASFAQGFCGLPGVMISAQRRAASRPKTTRSSSELLTQAVGAVHRDAGRLADRHEARGRRRPGHRRSGRTTSPWQLQGMPPML